MKKTTLKIESKPLLMLSFVGLMCQGFAFAAMAQVAQCSGVPQPVIQMIQYSPFAGPQPTIVSMNINFINGASCNPSSNSTDEGVVVVESGTNKAFCRFNDGSQLPCETN